jgi:hypothetical protein
VEVLRLDCGIGRDATPRHAEAVAAFKPPAVTLRIEVGAEMIEDGKAVGRHPVIGEGEGRGEIGGAGFRRAVDAGLERIALPAAQPLRQAPIRRECIRSTWYFNMK